MNNRSEIFEYLLGMAAVILALGISIAGFMWALGTWK